MATAWVTLTEVIKYTGPWVMKPDKCVTQAITLSSSNQRATQAGSTQLDYAYILTDADCWGAVGAAASVDATVHASAFYIKSGIPYWVFVPNGHKVAVTTG